MKIYKPTPLTIPWEQVHVVGLIYMANSSISCTKINLEVMVVTHDAEQINQTLYQQDAYPI